jgi:hypothetical protein
MSRLLDLSGLAKLHPANAGRLEVELVFSSRVLWTKNSAFVVREECAMQRIAEYLADAATFDRMANEAKDEELKAALKKQAAAYRKLATERAQKLGIPAPDFLPVK